MKLQELLEKRDELKELTENNEQIWIDLFGQTGADARQAREHLGKYVGYLKFQLEAIESQIKAAQTA